MSSSIDEVIKEVIVLSDILQKQEFRACFMQHFRVKVEELLKIIPNDLDSKLLRRLQSKLFDSLKFHLKTTKNSTEKCVVIESLFPVLKLTPVNELGEFFDFYNLVFFQVFKGANLSYQPSEELKISVLEFCCLLLKSLTLTLVEKIYTEEFGAKFSLGISISVGFVTEERSIKIRLAALDFLLAASKYDNNVKYNIGIYNKVGDLFALYLPGILAPLLEVILRDETQHHLITVKAITCWGHVLCLVLSDSPESPSLSENKIMKQWLNTAKETGNKMIDVNKVLKGNKRTQTWVEAAATVIQPLIVKISEVRKHSHYQCRLELTKIMIKLLKSCAKNLKNSLNTVTEVLVSSAVDDSKEVSQIAEAALNKFEAEFGEKNVKLFVSVIEENLYSLITKLPRIVRSGDEKLSLCSLKSFSGYLRILGRLNQLEQLLSFSSTLKKLITAIRISVELELYPEISNQDFSIWDNDDSSNIWSKPWKRFKHFADKTTQNQLEDICHILGKFGKAETLLDYLLDVYCQEYMYRKEVLFIINEVVLGCSEIPDHVVRQLLDFYLETENIYPVLKVDESQCTNLKMAQSNIIKVALIMEGFGKLAKSIGKQFENYLLTTLYYVLEGMGNSYAIIRDAATRSAVEIANACGLNGNISSLIKNNVDYLTYHLTVKLKRNDSGVFDVVTVLLKNGPFETMPNLEEIINSVLKSSSQNFDSPHTIPYLRLFQTFVRSVNKWINVSNSKNPTTDSSTETPNEIDELIKFIESLEKKPENEEENEREEMEETEETEDEPMEIETPPLPRHLKMTLSVANHCLHYVASKDKDKKLIALEILNDSVWILADHENELLPLVHKIWSPLVGRFDQNTDELIINRSFTLLCTLSFTSKQFIRSRTLKSVLPTLQSFLIKEAPKSRLKDSSSGYFFTQNFKLLRELLEYLGMLATSLELFEEQLDLVVESVLPYLSSYQPKELQERCRKLFIHLQKYDPYVVWFKLQPKKDDPEYEGNVKGILNTMEQNI